MKLRIKANVRALIIFIICLLLCAFIFSIYTIKNMRTNLQVQMSTRTLIIALKDNLLILLNAETGERGYVISGDSSYLQPFNNAREQLSQNRALIKTLLQDRADEERKIDALDRYIDLKIDYIQKIIALKRAGDQQTVTALLISGQGKHLMDKIREINEEMQATQERNFAIIKQTTEQSFRSTRVVFITEEIASILITLLLAATVINELNRRTRNERELKSANAELQRKNAEIEQFAFVASHDLQQPLRSITNFSGLLAEKLKGQPDEDTRQYMSFISGSAARMSELISDLLEYSRIGKDAEKIKIDCNQLVNEVIADMNVAIGESGATINVGKLPVLMAYPYLGSVFRNLLSNAVKFSAKDQKPVISVSAKDSGDEYLFSIRDNGMGIEQKYVERIFIIFQRLHNRREIPGTGIGLSICKKIVEMHEGKIWVDSEPGKGSSFNFTIPKDEIK